MHSEAGELLKAEYGASAGAALDAARQLATRDPRVVAWLQEHGAGNDPQMVLMFARKALSMRAAGKLPAPTKRG